MLECAWAQRLIFLFPSLLTHSLDELIQSPDFIDYLWKAEQWFLIDVYILTPRISEDATSHGK